MENILELKALAEKVTGTPEDEVPGNTNAEVIKFISDNYQGGGSNVEFATYKTIGSDTQTMPAGGQATFTLDVDTKMNNSYDTLFLFWTNFGQMVYPVSNGDLQITSIMFAISETAESERCVNITVKNNSDSDIEKTIENYAGLAIKF